jgi:cobalt/nickel transport system permease protein
MHIPDGMLTTTTWTASWVGAAGFLGYALHEVRRKLTDSRLVLMAVLAALIFALQMLNFPVAGGTSGHFAGGAAAAIILGVWPAVVIMSTVLIIQSLLFADGGVTALGANILNMAVIGPFIGYAIWALFRRTTDSAAGKLVGSFTAAWTAVVASAIGAALMVWVSGAAPFGIVLGSMTFWHALIGIGEGLVTAGLVAYVLKVRPDIIHRAKTFEWRTVAVGMTLLAFLAAGVSFLASSSPDGLEFVGEDIGFLAESEPVFGGSPIPDYVIPGLSNEVLAGILAGMVGVVVTGAALYLLLGAIRTRRGGGEETA